MINIKSPNVLGIEWPSVGAISDDLIDHLVASSGLKLFPECTKSDNPDCNRVETPFGGPLVWSMGFWQEDKMNLKGNDPFEHTVSWGFRDQTACSELSVRVRIHAFEL